MLKTLIEVREGALHAGYVPPKVLTSLLLMAVLRICNDGSRERETAERTQQAEAEAARRAAEEARRGASVILEARLAAIRNIVERRAAIGDHRQVPVFSTDDAAPMWRNTLSGLIKEISDNMVKEGEARAPFQLRDIRRTAETILASLKVSKDVRSHLLSHGLGGVQNQHYDRHTYWSEKRQALKKWAAYLAKLKNGKTADAETPTDR